MNPCGGKMLHFLLLLAINSAVAITWLGCGGPTATLEIIAPSSSTVGTPISITVTAMAGSSRDTIFNSIVHFTSSDSLAVLPSDYEFTAADAGSHTFANAVIFMSSGAQSIKATDTVAPSIAGITSISVVSSGVDIHVN